MIKAPRWSAPVEIALYIGLTCALDRLWGPGDRFLLVEPHPFWGIVLLMAVQYGTREALMATVAASIALLANNTPAQGFGQSVHEYGVQLLQRPLLWMVASLVLGELRVRQRGQHQDTGEQLANAERRVELLTRAHTELAATKERLETRLAGQLRTATGMFEAARALETLEPSKVLAGAADLLAVALNARTFSLFILEGDALVLAAQQGWTNDEVYARRLSSSSSLFQEVVGAQRLVSVATPQGESALQGQGLVAGPLIDPATGRLVGMLKVEEMNFLDFNLSALHTFKALCDWIAAAYTNAQAHKSSQIEDEGTRLYGMKFLDRQTEYMTQVARRFGFDLTLLFYRIDVAGLQDEERGRLPALLGGVARTVLRRTDLAFSHEPPGTQFAVLLPGAPAEHAAAVTEKLSQGLREACGHDIPCTTRVQVLNRAADAVAHSGRRHAPVDEATEGDVTSTEKVA